jgi:hypothetical protein
VHTLPLPMKAWIHEPFGFCCGRCSPRLLLDLGKLRVVSVSAFFPWGIIIGHDVQAASSHDLPIFIPFMGYSSILPIMDEWDLSPYLIHPISHWIIHSYSSHMHLISAGYSKHSALVSSEDMISFNGHISLHGRPGNFVLLTLCLLPLGPPVLVEITCV